MSIEGWNRKIFALNMEAMRLNIERMNLERSGGSKSEIERFNRRAEALRKKQYEVEAKASAEARKINERARERATNRDICFISTAICTQLQKADDCYELSLLRLFRDELLARADGGPDLIEAYYVISPSLLAILMRRLKVDPNIYGVLFQTHLLPIIRMIECGQYEKAVVSYAGMLEYIAQLD